MTEQLELDLQGGEGTVPLIENGEDVMNHAMYEEIRSFIFERYTENDAMLAEATLILCGLGEFLKKELGLKFEVIVG